MTEKTQNIKNKNKKIEKNKKKAKQIKDRDNYFAFYDDIKFGNTNKVDW